MILRHLNSNSPRNYSDHHKAPFLNQHYLILFIIFSYLQPICFVFHFDILTLSFRANVGKKLRDLEKASEVLLNWFTDNCLKVNISEFHFLVTHKDNHKTKDGNNIAKVVNIRNCEALKLIRH